jgi:hypothetical protein
MKPKICGLGSRLKLQYHYQGIGVSGGKTENQPQKKPFLSLKAVTGTMITISIMLYSSIGWGIMGLLKSLKLLAEKPQCKLLDNARSVSTDLTLGILQKRT